MLYVNYWRLRYTVRWVRTSIWWWNGYLNDGLCSSDSNCNRRFHLRIMLAEISRGAHVFCLCWTTPWRRSWKTSSNLRLQLFRKKWTVISVVWNEWLVTWSEKVRTRRTRPVPFWNKNCGRISEQCGDSGSVFSRQLPAHVLQYLGKFTMHDFN